MTFCGAVLCGGASRRLGRDKAQVELDGRPMAARVASALHEAGADGVVAVGGDRAAIAAMGLEVVDDDQPGAGPLGATITALRRWPGQTVAVLACDLLRPSSSAVCSLVRALSQAEEGTIGAVPVVGGRAQWTHMVWRSEALRGLSDAWDGGVRSLHEAAARLALIEVLSLDPDALSDVDEPEDLP